MYILLIIFSLSLFTSIILVLALNPVSIGLIILTIALTLSIIYGITISSWIAFLLFLIYVGGILVIFAYFVALSPNRQVNNLIIIPSITTILLIFITLILNNIYTNINTNFQYLINTFYNNINIPILILLAIILFLTIVVVVKIVTNNKGPLRPFLNYV
jgi:NADH-ubiquinone oxidoreductase chain 6